MRCLVLLLLGTTFASAFSSAVASACEPTSVSYATELTTANNEKWRGRLVLYKQNETTVRGYFTWQPLKGNSFVECVVGNLSAADGTLHLFTAEIRSRTPLYSFCEYHADIDPVSRSLVNGVKVNPRRNSQEISWSGKFLAGATETTPAALTSWISPKDDRERLLRELSDGYVASSTVVIRQPVMANLLPLLESTDPKISSIAKTASAVVAYHELAVGNLDFSLASREFQRSLFSFAVSEFGRAHGDVAGSFRDAARIFGNPRGGFARAVGSFQASMERGPKVQSMQNALLARVAQYLKDASPKELPSQDLNVRIRLGQQTGAKINSISRAVLVVTNRRATALSGVYVTFQVKVDQARTKASWQQEEGHWDLSGAIQNLILSEEGEDEQDQLERAAMIDARKKAREAQIKTFMQGQGAMMYIDKLPSGVAIEHDLLGVYSLSHYVDSIRVTLGADEGQLPDIEYSQAELQDMVKKLAPQARR
jgi:hypothetical protein